VSTNHRAARLLLATVACAGACSAFNPAVGPLQDGGAAPACTLGSAGYGSSPAYGTPYGAPTGQAATNDFCTPEGGTIGGPCDVCEAASCCAERVACYSDQTCSCADEALDVCTTAADGGTAATLACWSAFAGSGTIGQTRYACLQKSCGSACQIPN
jgi:hypothetical protein